MRHGKLAAMVKKSPAKRLRSPKHRDPNFKPKYKKLKLGMFIERDLLTKLYWVIKKKGVSINEYLRAIVLPVLKAEKYKRV